VTVGRDLKLFQSKAQTSHFSFFGDVSDLTKLDVNYYGVSIEARFGSWAPAGLKDGTAIGQLSPFKVGAAVLMRVPACYTEYEGRSHGYTLADSGRVRNEGPRRRLHLHDRAQSLFPHELRRSRGVPAGLQLYRAAPSAIG